MKSPFLALGLAAVLTACGGGGSSTADTPTTDATTTAATATATAAGATLVTAPSGSTAYQLVADIGDSLTITFNPATGGYTAKVDKTQFSFADRVGTFTSSNSGDFTTYTLGSDNYKLVVDNRTKSIAGNMSMTPAGGTEKAFSVAGTGYQISDLSKLAGVYNFAYNTRNQSNGQDNDKGMGQLKISSDGATATLCTSGTVNASNTCDAVATGVTPELNTLTLTISNGLITASNGGTEWGKLRVHTGDLGLSLIIDRYGVNGSNVLRVGALYAVKAQTLAAGSGNGTWACNRLGVATNSFTVSGTALTNTPVGGSAQSGTLQYNQAGTGSSLVSVPGFVAMGSNDTNFLPLSSSLLVASYIADSTQPLTVCRKAS
jgi:hypothetical protein